ncbi:MAG: prolipoprotein diacylglyceryl transferase family protein [Gemmataceae bacterium]
MRTKPRAALRIVSPGRTMPHPAYALFMLLALGVFVLARRCFPPPPEVAAIPVSHRLLLALAAFVGGTLGAKLPFAFAAGFWHPEGWLTDGKTVTTGLAGAYVAVELAKMVLGIRVKTGDTFALPLAFALAVGRWGCFFNGCCAGTTSDLPWATDFGDGERRHPTQVYESLFHLAMAFAILWLMARGWLRTHRLQAYLVAYCGYRFATEFIRPGPSVALGLTFYQWFVTTFALALLAQWVWEASHSVSGAGTTARASA